MCLVTSVGTNRNTWRNLICLRLWRCMVRACTDTPADRRATLCGIAGQGALKVEARTGPGLSARSRNIRSRPSKPRSEKRDARGDSLQRL